MPHDTVFQIYVVSASILALNMMVLALVTGLGRLRKGIVRNPEDRTFNRRARLENMDEGMILRVQRAHLNALENIPLFLILALLFVFTSPSVTLAGALFGAYTLFRLLHSVAYIKALQPLRSTAYLMAQGTQGVMIVAMLIKVLSA